jgi:hypothetical protein
MFVTTAGVSGPVRVCIAYDDGDDDGFENAAGIAVARLRLLHAALPGFVDVTESADGGLVCGTVSDLSPFVLAAADESTTSTTLSGGGTTRWSAAAVGGDSRRDVQRAGAGLRQSA